MDSKASETPQRAVNGMTALPPTIMSALKAGDVKSFATIPATGESGLKVEKMLPHVAAEFFTPQNVEERTSYEEGRIF